jgi:hypothetical protein
LAKKWQDVEFVDYKERQKRRRLRKRGIAQEELEETAGSRVNTALVLGVLVFFGLILAGGMIFLLSERDFLNEKDEGMFLRASRVTGSFGFRKYQVDEFEPFQEGRKLLGQGFFKTGVDSLAELETMDGVSLRIRESSEFSLQSVEVFGDNKRTKTNLSLQEGGMVFDSRRSLGALLEVHVGELAVYAGKALFKMRVQDGELTLKVSQGVVRCEGPDGDREVGPSQFLESENGALSEVQGFNPLVETW